MVGLRSLLQATRRPVVAVWLRRSASRLSRPVCSPVPRPRQSFSRPSRRRSTLSFWSIHAPDSDPSVLRPKRRPRRSAFPPSRALQPSQPRGPVRLSPPAVQTEVCPPCGSWRQRSRATPAPPQVPGARRGGLRFSGLVRSPVMPPAGPPTVGLGHLARSFSAGSQAQGLSAAGFPAIGPWCDTALRARRSPLPKQGVGACPGCHVDRAILGDHRLPAGFAEARPWCKPLSPLCRATGSWAKSWCRLPKHPVPPVAVDPAGRGRPRRSSGGIVGPKSIDCPRIRRSLWRLEELLLSLTRRAETLRGLERPLLCRSADFDSRRCQPSDRGPEAVALLLSYPRVVCRSPPFAPPVPKHRACSSGTASQSRDLEGWSLTFSAHRSGHSRPGLCLVPADDVSGCPVSPVPGTEVPQGSCHRARLPVDWVDFARCAPTLLPSHDARSAWLSWRPGGHGFSSPAASGHRSVSFAAGAVPAGLSTSTVRCLPVFGAEAPFSVRSLPPLPRSVN